MLLSDTQLIAKLVNGKLSSSKAVKFEGVCTDTRDKVAGKLFIALEGNNFDGHSFIQKAEYLGAKVIIVNKKVNSNLPTIQVKNTEQAYQKLAAWHRKSCSLQVKAT